MKKYRITRIKIKTREIISLSKEATGEVSRCPVCHSPLSEALPPVEKKSGETSLTEDLKDAEKSLKGDL